MFATVVKKKIISGNFKGVLGVQELPYLFWGRTATAYIVNRIPS